MRPLELYLKQLTGNLRRLRRNAGLSVEELEHRLILGPGWISAFEQGESTPEFEVLLAILHEIGASLGGLAEGLPAPPGSDFGRFLRAEPAGSDLLIRFRYARFAATYRLHDATTDEFESVVRTLRNGLARLARAGGDSDERNIKTDSVARAFLKAVKLWPGANPSDLWWFMIYRAYCDPFNHPAISSDLDFMQSWKRTGGWALEEVLVRHYGPFLQEHGIGLFIADGDTKGALLSEVDSGDRLESDKVDVVLTGGEPARLFGVVHVKTSFAERRTDDVPMSVALRDAGYTTPLWTMDCKSVPSEWPTNSGELGQSHGRRSAKRRDIEDEAYFTGCFSYNLNTNPSAQSVASDRRVYVCDFKDPDDAFSRFIRKRWRTFQKRAT